MAAPGAYIFTAMSESYFAVRQLKKCFGTNYLRSSILSCTIITAATENNYLHLMVCFVR